VTRGKLRLCRGTFKNDRPVETLERISLSTSLSLACRHPSEGPIPCATLTSHECHRLDVEIVENTVQVDLPKLIVQIDQMLAVI
jgi:hypothetical protein